MLDSARDWPERPSLGLVKWKRAGRLVRPGLFRGESLQMLEIEALAMSEACCSLSLVSGGGKIEREISRNSLRAQEIGSAASADRSWEFEIAPAAV